MKMYRYDRVTDDPSESTPTISSEKQSAGEV